MLRLTRRTNEQLRHEPVIRNRRLVVGTVRQHLHLHLVLNRGASKSRPFLSQLETLEHGARELQPEQVAEKVVAGHLVCVLEVVEYEDGVIEERGVRARPERIVEHSACAHELKANRPADNAQAHVHRARPVDADACWIGLDEVVELARDLDGEALVVRQVIRLAENRPMLAPRELPRVLDIGVPRAHFEKVPLLVGHPPGKPELAHGVQIPVDRSIAERCGTIWITRYIWATAKQIELVPEHTLRSGNSGIHSIGMTRSKMADRFRRNSRVELGAPTAPPAPVRRRESSRLRLVLEGRRRRRCRRDGSVGRDLHRGTAPEPGEPFEHQRFGFRALMMRFQPMIGPRLRRGTKASTLGTPAASSCRWTISMSEKPSNSWRSPALV